MPVCPKCQGKRVLREIDLVKAKTTERLCPECGGTGLDPKAQMNGIRVGRPCCKVLLYQYLEKGEPIATLEVWAFPVLIEGKQVMVRVNGSPHGLPAVMGEIHQMHTVKEHRRRGLQRKLLIVVLGDPSFRYVRTSLVDSTEAGIAVCRSVGMVDSKDGKWLEWRRKGAPNG